MPHALPPGEDVQLSKYRVFVGNTNRTSGEPMIGCNKVRVVSGLTSTAVCTCRVTEAMTATELINCITTVTAMLLNVPRISITILWRPQSDSPHELVANVVINEMSSWTAPSDELYDARFDSNLLDARTYSFEGLIPCRACGDPAVDIDNVCVKGWCRARSEKREYLPWDLLKLRPDLDRDDLCVRCEPPAMCENCRFSVNGKPVCMCCLQDSEVAALPASAQRRYGLLHVD